MPNRIPQVVVVTGPQRGARAALNKNIMTIGRTAPAELCINENVVSRQQAQLTLTQDGWVIENLSKNGAFGVNDKPYKPGKKLLIETGDVIFVGQQTKLLFIDTDQDPQAVINQYLINNPLPVAPVEIAEPEPEAPRIDPNNLSEQDLSMMLADQPAEILDEEELQKQNQHSDSQIPVAEEVTPEQLEDEAKKNKRKKLLIGAGIYFTLMIIGLFAVITLKGNDESPETNPSKSIPTQLSESNIKSLLTSQFKRSANADQARKYLNYAKNLYINIKSKQENAYLCVAYFRLFKAYKLNLPPAEADVFDDFKVEEYNQAIAELVEIVNRYYSNMLLAEKYNAKMNNALADADILLNNILPRKQINEINDENAKKLRENISKHYKYISKKLERQRRR